MFCARVRCVSLYWLESYKLYLYWLKTKIWEYIDSSFWLQHSTLFTSDWIGRYPNGCYINLCLKFWILINLERKKKGSNWKAAVLKHKQLSFFRSLDDESASIIRIIKGAVRRSLFFILICTAAVFIHFSLLIFSLSFLSSSFFRYSKELFAKYCCFFSMRF